MLIDGDIARACNRHLENLLKTAAFSDFVRIVGVEDGKQVEELAMGLPGRRAAGLPRLDVDFQAVPTAPRNLTAERAYRRFIFGIAVVAELDKGQWYAQDYADAIAAQFKSGAFLEIPLREDGELVEGGAIKTYTDGEPRRYPRDHPDPAKAGQIMREKSYTGDLTVAVDGVDPQPSAKVLWVRAVNTGFSFNEGREWRQNLSASLETVEAAA